MNSQLAPGETILWRGGPAPGLRFSTGDIFAIPFTLFWLGTVAAIGIGIGTADNGRADPIGWLIFPVFLAVGLYMLIGRFVVDIITRKRISYTLTNKRAIIEGGLLSTRTRSITLGATPEIGFSEGRGGRGTVEFGTIAAGPFGMLPRNWPGAARYFPPAFEGIEDARRVYALALQGQRGD